MSVSFFHLQILDNKTAGGRSRAHLLSSSEWLPLAVSWGLRGRRGYPMGDGVNETGLL